MTRVFRVLFAIAGMALMVSMGRSSTIPACPPVDVSKTLAYFNTHPCSDSVTYGTWAGIIVVGIIVAFLVAAIDDDTEWMG